MDARTLDLVNLFSPNIQYEVPIFQLCCVGDVFSSGFPYYSDIPPDDDAGFFARRSNQTEVTARIWKYDTSEWRLITHHEWSSRALGLTLCVSASRAADNGEDTYCGEVVDEYMHVGNVLYERWTRIDFTEGQFNQGVGPGSGGSGGPAFWGGTAYGILTHCSTMPACPEGLVYQARYLHAALKAHNADARLLCDDDGIGTNMAVKCEPS